MALRKEWKFEYSAAVLLDKTVQRITYHEQRLAFWKGEEATADKRAKASAQFKEYPITGGTRTELVLDPTEQARLDECRRRLNHHREWLRGYAAFQDVFQQNLGSQLVLDVDDIVYFTRGEGDPE